MLLVLEEADHFLFKNYFVTFQVCDFLYLLCWLMLTVYSIYVLLREIYFVYCKGLTICNAQGLIEKRIWECMSTIYNGPFCNYK